MSLQIVNHMTWLSLQRELKEELIKVPMDLNKMAELNFAIARNLIFVESFNKAGSQ